MVRTQPIPVPVCQFCQLQREPAACRFRPFEITASVCETDSSAKYALKPWGTTNVEQLK
jgi:hypothetical protein